MIDLLQTCAADWHLPADSCKLCFWCAAVDWDRVSIFQHDTGGAQLNGTGGMYTCSMEVKSQKQNITAKLALGYWVQAHCMSKTCGSCGYLRKRLRNSESNQKAERRVFIVLPPFCFKCFLHNASLKTAIFHRLLNHFCFSFWACLSAKSKKNMQWKRKENLSWKELNQYQWRLNYLLGGSKLLSKLRGKCRVTFIVTFGLMSCCGCFPVTVPTGWEPFTSFL